jgi:hypothetical protein
VYIAERFALISITRCSRPRRPMHDKRKPYPVLVV